MTFIPEKTVIIVSLKIIYVQDMTILICVPLFEGLNTYEHTYLCSFESCYV